MDGERRRSWLADVRADFPAVLAVFVASRLLLLLVVAAIEGAIPLQHDRPTYTDRPVPGALTGHDAIYYLGIAVEGYRREPVQEPYVERVFFPLFPAAARLASIPLGGDVALGGVLVANVAALVGLVLFALESRRIFDGDTGAVHRSVVLLAFAPGAVAFGMAYSESLLLALSLGAVMAAERQRWLSMGVLFGLAALCRPPEILIGVALGIARSGVEGTSRGATRLGSPRDRRPHGLPGSGPTAGSGRGVSLARLAALRCDPHGHRPSPKPSGSRSRCWRWGRVPSLSTVHS